MKVVIAVLSLVLTTSAFAAERPRFGDTFWFGLGGMSQYGSADFSSGSDDRIDLDELGLDDDVATVWATARWRFTPRWEAGFSYSSYNSEGLVGATYDWSFGDIDVTADATVDSDFDLDLYIVDISWDFVLSENAHAGVGLGLHVMDLGLAIDAQVEVDINGQPLPNPIDLGRESATVTAPLPDIQVNAGYTFGEKVYIGAKLGYFSLEYDKYDGSLTSIRLDAEWRAWKNVGLGLGYQYVKVDLKVDETDFQDRYDFTFSGPILYISAAF